VYADDRGQGLSDAALEKVQIRNDGQGGFTQSMGGHARSGHEWNLTGSECTHFDIDAKDP
jgi:hypothetical protein